MKKKYIIALDEGTTSTRAALFNVDRGEISCIVSRSVAQIYPQPGYVEEDAAEIYAASLSALVEIIEKIDPEEIFGIGITNQRETIVFWNKITGRPIYNAIVWQCRRTSEFADRLKRDHGDFLRKKTGLIPDAYFSATKIKWVFDNVPEAKRLASRGELCVGTIDSYLVFKLTEGRAFVTDATNASRTMLFNIGTMRWDDDLLKMFGVPASVLPEIVPCDAPVGDFVFGNRKIPICGIAGDQQAALFGQCCFNVGEAKITYGTGLFMLMNVGSTMPTQKGSVLTTVASYIGEKVEYALEGSVFNAGSAVQWLRDGLRVIENAADSEALAASVEDTGGVYVVPAFTGLGAPYWDGDARGLITGITRGTNIKHIVRAVLEAMAYSARDLSEAMAEISGYTLKLLRVDGGAAANNFLMQFQSDVLKVNVDRPMSNESTSLGAAFLCGTGLKIFGRDDLFAFRKNERIFTPSTQNAQIEALYRGWQNAVAKCLYKGENK